MRPSGRQFLLISQPVSLPNGYIFFSLLISSSLLNTRLSRLWGNRWRVALLWLPLLALRLVPSPSSMGGGRSFEVSSPPSQLRMRGVLVRYWNFWLSCGTEEWTVEVLQLGYGVPFHHLPPVSH